MNEERKNKIVETAIKVIMLIEGECKEDAIYVIINIISSFIARTLLDTKKDILKDVIEAIEKEFDFYKKDIESGLIKSEKKRCFSCIKKPKK